MHRKILLITSCQETDYNNNNYTNVLHWYSTFLGIQSALHGKGESPRPPSMCIIHLDDATAAILCQNAHHTPAYCFFHNNIFSTHILCCGIHSRVLTKLLAIYSQLHRVHWTIQFLRSSKSRIGRPKQNLHLNNSTEALHSSHSQSFTHCTVGMSEYSIICICICIC